MKIKNNAITLSNRESRAAGYHNAADWAAVYSAAAGAERFEIHKLAHDLANRTGRGVRVYATRRNCQPRVVYVCEAVTA